MILILKKMYSFLNIKIIFYQFFFPINTFSFSFYFVSSSQPLPFLNLSNFSFSLHFPYYVSFHLSLSFPHISSPKSHTQSYPLSCPPPLTHPCEVGGNIVIFHNHHHNQPIISFGEGKEKKKSFKKNSIILGNYSREVIKISSIGRP